MATFVSKPTRIEAVRFSREIGPPLQEVLAFGGDKVKMVNGTLTLLAGKDGAQEWVPVPLGHWLVRQPGDPSDIWPVDHDYFLAKYDAEPTS